MSNHEASRDVELRELAVARLKKRRDFHAQLLLYVLFSAFFVVIWAATSADAFFWPVFPIVGWGIFVAMSAWDVYRPADFTEERIDREVEHLQDLQHRE